MDTGKNGHDTKEDRTGKTPSRFTVNWLILVLIVAGLSLFFFSDISVGTKEISWNDFKADLLQKHRVAKIEVINKERAEVFLKPEYLIKPEHRDVSRKWFGMVNYGPHYKFSIGSVENLERRLEEAQAQFSENEKIPVVYTSSGSGWLVMLFWLLPIALLMAASVYAIRKLNSSQGKSGTSLFDFGKSHPAVFEKGKLSAITFKDVAGYEEAKQEVMEIVEFLKQPENFTRLGAKIPKGILLVGSPGTGKTLMAKAVAGEAGVPFFSLSGSEFIEMFVGVGASRVRDLFTKAKQKAPSIIFIDEIDTIGRIRGKSAAMQANDERESTLNQLLAEMDGFAPNTGVIVMAATNRADILDPALLRPGRFDRHIQLDPPNKDERLAIFKVHIKPLVVSEEIDAEMLSLHTAGFSGADIANICNEAALIAARKKKKAIEMQDFLDAIDRVVAGLEKKGKVISAVERKTIAFHEAGHAVISWMLPHADPLLKVSIIPRGKSLGGAWFLPEEHQLITKSQFIDKLCVALGGRTAEEIVFSEASSGALDDLEKATKQAYMMVANLGLSERVGSISFYDSTGMNENSFQKPFSEATAQMIDEEVRKLIEHAHDCARSIIEMNRDKLDRLANLLLEKEVVFKKDLQLILGDRPLEEHLVTA
jgi:AFG3 family protein